MNGSYPDHQIDPRKKGKDWILQYCKAAWQDAGTNLPLTSLYRGRDRYNEIRQYALGKQSIDKYKKAIFGDDIPDTSVLSNNWNVYAIIPKYREISVSKIIQRLFNINAFAIDESAKSEEDAYYAKIRTKIIMRDAAMQASPKLAQSPVLQKATGEPDDLEELEIQAQFGYKHNLAIQSENAINLSLQNNKIDRERKKIAENLYDFGLAGYKDWIDEYGMVRFRSVDPKVLITSYCNQPDFSDMVHCGEVIEVRVADLAPYFTNDEMSAICKANFGQLGNPMTIDSVNGVGNYFRFKCQVLDIQFYSWNTTVYEDKIDKRGNKRFVKTNFSNIKSTQPQPAQQSDGTAKFINNTVQVVYQCKWIIGTSFCYEYGLKKNQNRKKSNWWSTTLDYHLYAWNFDRMNFTGITERLMPCADSYQLTKMRLDNLKMDLIPYLIKLDVSGFENVALGKGSANMKPIELVEFMFQKGVILWNSKDLVTGNPNYSPADIVPSGQLQAFAQLYADLQNTLQEIQNISGFNALTDGTSVNPKMLNGVASMQESGTNNSLYLLSDAEKYLLLQLCDSIVQKTQIAVTLGKVEGYAKALGTNAIKFFQIDPKIANSELGVFLEDMPTDQQREGLMAQLAQYNQEGLVDPSDVLLIQGIRDLKEAQARLAYLIKNKVALKQQQALQQQQMNGQIQVQSAQQAEQGKQQTALLLHKCEMEKQNVIGQWNYVVAEVDAAKVVNAAQVAGQAKTIAATIAAEAKKHGDILNHFDSGSGNIPSINPIQVSPPPMPQQPPPQTGMPEGSPQEQATDTGGEMPNEAQEQQQ